MNKPITTLVILSIALAITIIALIVIDSRTDELFAQPKPVVFSDGHLHFTERTFTEPNEPIGCDCPRLRVALEGDIFCINCGAIYRQGMLVDPNESK